MFSSLKRAWNVFTTREVTEKDRRNAEYLYGHVKTAIPMLELPGGDFTAGEPNKWYAHTEKDEAGHKTGKLVMWCVEYPSLKLLADRLETEGFQVQRRPLRHSLIITPPAA